VAFTLKPKKKNTLMNQHISAAGIYLNRKSSSDLAMIRGTLSLQNTEFLQSRQCLTPHFGSLKE